MATHPIARDDPPAPHDGGCACRFVRYRMASKPLFVHRCHCRWCQRETGASFALNALMDLALPALPGRALEQLRRRGRCDPLVRVGTLDQPDRLRPDIHIYTASKQPWVVIPADTPAVPEYYRASERWPKESLERRAALLARSKR